MFTAIESSEFIGKELSFMTQCHSTNDFVIEKCKNETINQGFLAITTNQTSGRGQRGNRWISQPNKNLTFSFILNAEKQDLEHIFKINMLICIAIVDALNNIYSADNPIFKIKWPNDIFYNKQKLGGILIEIIKDKNAENKIVVGIGLNVNQTEFDYLNATSLANIFQTQFDLQLVLEKIIASIESYLKLFEIPTENIIQNMYLKHLFQYNEIARYKIDNQIIEAKIVEIKNDGKIGLLIDNSIKYFEKKELVSGVF